MSGEPELGLTTLSGELVLELTTPTGFTIKCSMWGYLLVNDGCYGPPRFLSGEPELELITHSGDLVLELTTPTGIATEMISKSNFQWNTAIVIVSASDHVVNPKSLGQIGKKMHR